MAIKRTARRNTIRRATTPRELDARCRGLEIGHITLFPSPLSLYCGFQKHRHHMDWAMEMIRNGRGSTWGQPL